MSDVLIPVTRFRPLAEAWVAQHDQPREAHDSLAAASGIKADSWRRRLSDEHSDVRCGWFALEAIDMDDVDEFLTAAGLTHLWQTELRDLLPEPRLSDEEFDETCAECGRWIDWARGDAGIRVEVQKKGPGHWPRWCSLCSLCACEHLYIRPRRPTGSGRYAPKDIPEQVIRDLYRRYLLEQIGLAALAEKVYEQHGWPTANACEAWLSRKWHQIGFPIRSISETKVTNRRNGHVRWSHRFTPGALRHAHALHMRADVSMNQLGRQLYRRYGYASHTTCAMAIANGWRQLGLQPRARIEMTVAVTTKHGLLPRGRSGAQQRRVRAQLNGEPYDVPCTAATTRGKPCGRNALRGKTLCYNHDPDRADERDALIARYRGRSPFDPANTVPFGDIPARLNACFETHGRRWKPLTELTGKSNTSLKHFASKAPEDRMMRSTKDLLERALDQLEHAGLEVAA